MHAESKKNENSNIQKPNLMADSFKEMFDVMEREFSPLDFNKNYYRKMAERIALNGKGNVILLAIFIAATLGAVIMFDQLRISKRDHIIAKQRMELSVIKQDSVFYKCPHCLKEHSLRLIPDSTINAPQL